MASKELRAFIPKRINAKSDYFSISNFGVSSPLRIIPFGYNNNPKSTILPKRGYWFYDSETDEYLYVPSAVELE